MIELNLLVQQQVLLVRLLQIPTTKHRFHEIFHFYMLAM